MTNLRLLYDKLTQDPRPFNISLMEPCSYIKALTDCNNNENVIFAYKQKRSYTKQPNKISKPHSSNLNCTTSAADLSGTPLEDDCEIDLIDVSIENNINEQKMWSDAEESLAPISLDEAREFLMEVTTDSKNKQFSGTIWVLCEPTSEENTIIKHVTLEPENTRGLVYFNGFTKFDDINLKKLAAQHFNYIANKSPLHTQIDSYFTIHKSMTLKYTAWNTSKELSLKSLRSSNISLLQSIKVGDCESVAIEFWHQLELLDMINTTVKNYKRCGSADALEYNFKSTSSMDTDEITDKMYKILKDISPIYQENDDGETVQNLQQIVQKSQNRSCIDVTDHMWMLLQKSRSYDDLKIIFAKIFQWAANGVIINVPIDDCHVSKLIREISEKRIAIPCLTGSEPLELLLEIGIEKVTKDYEQIFANSKMCSGKDLFKTHNAATAAANDRQTTNIAATSRKTCNPKLFKNTPTIDGEELCGFQNSKYDQCGVENKLAKLCQIHIILEHLLLIENYINLSSMHHFVQTQLEQSPKPFRSIKPLSLDHITIELNHNQISLNMEDRKPSTLRIKMSSVTKFQDVTNVFYFSISPIFPTNIYPDMQVEDKVTNKDQSLYGALHYLKLSTKYG